jgi:hypothetical protein
MKVVRHSPPYALQIHGRWRVVVPVRDRLTPKICPQKFPTRASAETWLQSEEGARTVELARSRLPLVAETSHGAAT